MPIFLVVLKDKRSPLTGKQGPLVAGDALYVYLLSLRCTMQRPGTRPVASVEAGVPKMHKIACVSDFFSRFASYFGL